MRLFIATLTLLLLLTFSIQGRVRIGIERCIQEKEYQQLLKGKNIGLITNHTAIDARLKTTFHILKEHGYKIVALFAPEHGFYGENHAGKMVSDATVEGISLFSLHGKNRRPTAGALKGIDLLIYDMQDIGARSYTYISTLFYCMEAASAKKIPILILDRPNPMGGLTVDGPLLEEEWRSFVGYINVPYCHGMTVGELAHFFNEEYQIGADLTVIPMQGWKREMVFTETNLPWIPTSPNIPESDTPLYYATTGILGELSIVNMGIGYTLPFKVIGAPWINAEIFAQKLNQQKLPGVTFYPFHFIPFYGKYKQESCQGVKIHISDPRNFFPVTTQYTILAVLKMLYNDEIKKALHHLMNSPKQKEFFCKINGTEKIFQMVIKEQFFIWKLREQFRKDREYFLEKRKKYLFPDY